MPTTLEEAIDCRWCSAYFEGPNRRADYARHLEEEHPADPSGPTIGDLRKTSGPGVGEPAATGAASDPDHPVQITGTEPARREEPSVRPSAEEPQTRAPGSDAPSPLSSREQLDASRPPRADRPAERGSSGSEVRLRVPPPAPPSPRAKETAMEICTKVAGCTRPAGHTGMHNGPHSQGKATAARRWAKARGGGSVKKPDPPKPVAPPELKPPKSKPAASTPDPRLAIAEGLAQAAEAFLVLIEAPISGGRHPDSDEWDRARWRLGAAIADWQEANDVDG